MCKKYTFFLLFLISFSALSQQSYYNKIDFSKSGLALKNDLATLIINTHTNFLSYTPGIWNASKQTDVNPKNASQVMLIYGFSNAGTTARTRGVNDNGGNVGDWNREHTYPRSLGNPNLGTSGAGADAHHLRPSDVRYNGQRGNKPFADGTGNSGTVAQGWFPGDEWKGDVARMIMYMYLRYNNQCLPSVVGIGSATSTPDDMIDLFLKWNAEDPVSILEDNRNTYHENTNNTYAQGNRNPFIDNPFLATKIWGNPPSGTPKPEDRWGNLTLDNTTFFKLKIYSNPKQRDFLFLNRKADFTLEVFNVIGKKILSKEVKNKKNIDISSLKNGIYILKISQHTGSITQKFLKL